jgi:hypothetical protein
MPGVCKDGGEMSTGVVQGRSKGRDGIWKSDMCGMNRGLPSTTGSYLTGNQLTSARCA